MDELGETAVEQTQDSPSAGSRNRAPMLRTGLFRVMDPLFNTSGTYPTDPIGKYRLITHHVRLKADLTLPCLRYQSFRKCRHGLSLMQNGPREPGTRQNIAKNDQSSFAGIRARRVLPELSSLNCCCASVTIHQACGHIATGHNDPLRRSEK